MDRWTRNEDRKKGSRLLCLFLSLSHTKVWEHSYKFIQRTVKFLHHTTSGTKRNCKQSYNLFPNLPLLKKEEVNLQMVYLEFLLIKLGFYHKKIHISPLTVHLETPNSELNVGSLTLKESYCLSEITAGWWFISYPESVCMSWNLISAAMVCGWSVTFSACVCSSLQSSVSDSCSIYGTFINQAAVRSNALGFTGDGAYGTHTQTHIHMNKLKMKRTHYTQRSHARGIAFPTDNIDKQTWWHLTRRKAE